MRSITNIMVLAMLVGIVASAAGPMASGRQEREQGSERANQAIAQLWSSDQGKRHAAKATLLDLRADAVQPLLSFLEDLTANDIRRYEIGKEPQGAQALEDFKGSRSSSDEKERIRAAQRLADLDISPRLEFDVCELLGDLHAAEAIPLLTRLSWSRFAIAEYLSFRVYLESASIAALVKIGSAAVPEIVKAINDADEDAAKAFPRRFFGPKIKTKGDLANLIRSTLANVLGQISDPAALPVLQTLLDKSDDREVRFYCTQAVSMIKRKM